MNQSKKKKLSSLKDSTGKLQVLSRVQILLSTVGWALRFTSTGHRCIWSYHL